MGSGYWKGCLEREVLEKGIERDVGRGVGRGYWEGMLGVVLVGGVERGY